MAVAYAELVSGGGGGGGGSKTRKFKWLVKVGASIVTTPWFKNIYIGRGVSGQPKTHLDTPLDGHVDYIRLLLHNFN